MKRKKHDDSIPRIIEDSLLYSFKPKILGLVYIFEFVFITSIFASILEFIKTMNNLIYKYYQQHPPVFAAYYPSSSPYPWPPQLKHELVKTGIYLLIKIGFIFILQFIGILLILGIIIRGSYEYFEKGKLKGIKNILNEIPKISYLRAFFYLVFVSILYGLLTDILTYLHVPVIVTIAFLVCVMTPLLIFALPEIYVKNNCFIRSIAKSKRIFKEKYYYLIPIFGIEYIISVLINLLFSIPFFLTLYKFGAFHTFRSVLAIKHTYGVKVSTSILLKSAMIKVFKTLLTQGKIYLIISYLSFLMGVAVQLIFKNAFVTRVYGVMERKLKI